MSITLVGAIVLSFSDTAFPEETVDLEEWKLKTIKDIMSMIKENRTTEETFDPVVELDVEDAEIEVVEAEAVKVVEAETSQAKNKGKAKGKAKGKVKGKE